MQIIRSVQPKRVYFNSIHLFAENIDVTIDVLNILSGVQNSEDPIILITSILYWTFYLYEWYLRVNIVRAAVDPASMHRA